MIGVGIKLAIGALILVVLAVALFPTLKDSLAGVAYTGNTSTSNTSAAEWAVLSIIGIVIIIALVMAVLKSAGLI